ncbi:MAG TPA: peptide ABC transporter substrate-binding protein [Candidatus Baltobacteraceae bacterium]|nr:peptide ABC transporter substrate-binding protein [Candidatus Baltobacteraceae bacterium]
MRRSGSRLAALVAAAVLLASACTRAGNGAAGARHPWTQPGVLRIATILSPNTLNPLISTQQIEAQIEGMIFDPLVSADEHQRPVPILASVVPTLENGGISRDGLTITYHLRHGVKWQDGVPFTSADVAFSVHALMNPNTNITTRHGYDDITRVDTPDPYTAVFHLERPFAPAVNTFFAPSDAPYFIVPAHLLAKYASLNRVAFNQAPIGTGPFKLARWVRGDELEFVPNDAYFGGKPKLQRIVLRLVPDENTAANLTRSHEIDWFMEATPRTYPQLTGIDGVRVRLVSMNANDAILFNTARPAFADPRVRRAIGLAIDKQRLVRDLTYGTTIAATEDLPSFMWAFDPHAGTAKRDLKAADALLNAAGWRRGADGIRVKSGQRFSMGLAYRSDSITDRQRSVLIASMLHEAGIEVQLKGYTTALLYAGGETGILSGGKYDAGLQTWYAGIDPDDSSEFLCSEVAPKGYDWTRYCDPEMDAAQHTALTHYDEATRKRAYAQIQTLLARDAPEVYLWWPRQIESVNTDFKGFRPNGVIETWNSWEWSI